MGSNTRRKIFTFQDEVAELSNGNELNINPGIMTVTLEITGSGTNKVIFEGQVIDGSAFYPITGINLNGFGTATEVTAKDLVYQISLEGLQVFRVRVSEFTDGNITVKGTVVD